MTTPRIPLSDLDYGEAEEAAVLRVLRSGWLSMGAEVEAFEGEFAAFLGAKHAVAVGSATAALHLIYAALDIGPGAEVIQPAINFVAAANTAVALGATPVFADIVALDEPTVDPSDVERKITSRTRAVVAMHYGGYLSRLEELQHICRRRGLILIEDACHAVGARADSPGSASRSGAMAGTLGHASAFSFFANKNLVTGEGGMAVTQDDDTARRMRLLRSHGMTTLTWDRHRGHASSYDVVTHGFNFRTDELHAALGRTQLAKLTRNNATRKRLVEVYRERLAAIPGWIVPFSNYRGDTAAHLMVVVAPDQESRHRVAGALAAEGIQTSVHYPSIPGFTAFRRFDRRDTHRSTAFATRALTLPLFPGLREEQVDEIAQVIRRTAVDAAVR